MRCCHRARFPFDSPRAASWIDEGRQAEEVIGASVTIGRRTYPVKQVGQVVTRQDRRDFSADEVLRAMAQLGFTCRDLSRAAAPERILSPLQQASAMLGAPAAV
ncbi:SCO5918 family protein [Streptomyces stelliscabiei]|uniref:SCO5918 family protein n=1 Tax=Streptomyces stelliscabiei TaxID=146820 RepID=UPI002FEED145